MGKPDRVDLLAGASAIVILAPSAASAAAQATNPGGSPTQLQTIAVFGKERDYKADARPSSAPISNIDRPKN